MNPKKYGRPAVKTIPRQTTEAVVEPRVKQIVQSTKSRSFTRHPVVSRKIVEVESDEEPISDSSEELVGETSLDEGWSDSEDESVAKKTIKQKAVVKKTLPKKGTTKKSQLQIEDVVRSIGAKKQIVVHEESDSASSDEETISMLTDDMFSESIGEPVCTDLSVIEYRMPKSEYMLSFIKCPHSSCNRVISDMSDMFQSKIDGAQQQSQKQKGRNMTVEEYNTFVSTTYDEYGNVFNKGGLDKSVTVYSDDIMHDISLHRRKFLAENEREMTSDEYNEYIEHYVEPKIKYNGKYANYIETTKQEFAKHFRRKMTISDFEDYSGNSDTALGKMSRQLISTYTITSAKHAFLKHFGYTLLTNGDDILEVSDLAAIARQMLQNNADKEVFLEYIKSTGNVTKDIVNEYSDYTLAKITRQLINTYSDTITDNEYNDLVNQFFARANKMVTEKQAQFYKAYGREIIRHQVFIPDAGELDRIVSTNSYVLESECCRLNIMQRIVLPEGRNYNDRQIVEEGERYGNIVQQKLVKPIPYNPFTFGNELAKMQLDMPVKTIRSARGVPQTIAIADDIEGRLNIFPLMPDTSGFDFEDEAYDPFAVEQPKGMPYKVLPVSHETVTHKIFTGVEGMETYRIAGRTIIAR